jgi:hypothetical protein
LLPQRDRGVFVGGAIGAELKFQRHRFAMLSWGMV